MPLSLPEIHTHPASGHTILPLLLPFLPYSLALVRRLQFHGRTEHSHVLASFPPFTTTELPREFVVAYVDRSRATETECWLFSSLEIPSGRLRTRRRRREGGGEEEEEDLGESEDGGGNNVEEEEGRGRRDTFSAQLRSLLLTLKRLDSPYTHAPPPLPSAPIDTSILLVGGLHERVLRHMRTYLPAGIIKRTTEAYVKYVFDTHARPLKERKEDVLEGSGLRWGKVRERDFQLVMSRTDIPRKERTLVLLPSVALFPPNTNTGSAAGEPGSHDSYAHGVAHAGDGRDEEGAGAGERDIAPTAPIAWAFLGPDASLTALHVEPSHRGLGLARILTANIFAERLPDYTSVGDGALRGEDYRAMGNDGWAHADVGEENLASRRVCMALGGREVEGGRVSWTWVDLTKLDLEQEGGKRDKGYWGGGGGA
ncbi:MAG: hypothetical protein M1827_004336 [Pycnora praestabilis]|nr:MAG: hypothetical protein M1827_004336 [Pycnora praestabilis]